jgi:hypothetical protein
MVKLYPQDIELTVERSHPALRPACCAAFRSMAPAKNKRRRAEVEPGTTGGSQPPRERALIQRRRADVRPFGPFEGGNEHDARVHTVVLLRAGRIPKTTSGKVQRHACQTSFLKGTLERLGEK